MLIAGGHGHARADAASVSSVPLCHSPASRPLSDLRTPHLSEQLARRVRLSLEVEAAVTSFLDSWRTQGSPWDRWVGEVERLRAVFAGSIGADADEIAVMPNASTAIAAIATALPFDGTRRSIVLGEFEFPTMAHVWQAQQRRGARVEWVKAQGETLAVERYAARIDERTLLVPATHVCFRNGYRLDIRRLAALCRERGAYFMLDDYQRTGTAPLDVHALGVDFLVTGALKVPARSAWRRVSLRAARSDRTARAAVHRMVRPRRSVCVQPRAGRLVHERAALRDRIAARAERLRGRSPASSCCRQSMPRRSKDRSRASSSASSAGARTRGFEVATPEDPGARGPLVVLRATDAAALVQRLAARGIVVSSRATGLRVSFHGYNNEQDVDAVLDALDAEARFLSRA